MTPYLESRSGVSGISDSSVIATAIFGCFLKRGIASWLNLFRTSIEWLASFSCLKPSLATLESSREITATNKINNFTALETIFLNIHRTERRTKIADFRFCWVSIRCRNVTEHPQRIRTHLKSQACEWRWNRFLQSENLFAADCMRSPVVIELDRRLELGIFALAFCIQCEFM